MPMISWFPSSRAQFRALDSLLDTQLPIDMQVRGTISQVDLRGAETLQDFLENWRSANGHVDITGGSLTSGRLFSMPRAASISTASTV